MAAIMGTTGQITATGDDVMLLTKAWSFDWIRAIHDASVFAASNGEYDVTLPGMHGLSGSAEGWLDDTTAVSMASFKTDGLTFVLTSSSGKTYTFTGNFTNFSPTAETDVVNSWTATFDSTGAITVA